MGESRDHPGGGFLVDEFIGSITTQLDRVQDALRIKAVNRPLTYALKELHLELKVFVDMDAKGQVLLRSSGPNEAGASTLAMDFTTITKPMIEENTISLATTRSTPLQNLGLSAEEQSRLERLGVSNLAQLDRLRGSTGVGAVARMADVAPERLRRALQAGRPRLSGVTPARPRTPVQTRPVAPKQPAASTRPPSVREPAAPGKWPLKPGVRLGVTGRPAPQSPALPVRTTPRRGLEEREEKRSPRPDPRSLAEDLYEESPFTADGELPTNVVEIPPLTRSLTLTGRNLQNEETPPLVRLDGAPLEIEELDDDRIVVRLPESFEPGILEVVLDGEEPSSFALIRSPEHAGRLAPTATERVTDPWMPEDSSRGGDSEA